MDLSRRWLGDYVKLDVTPKEFSDRMTMSGSKVECYQTEGAQISGVLVGKVLSIEKHPNADSLVVCQIDACASSPLQIVTGAKNLAVGDLVPVATDGARLVGEKEIKTSELRGELSQGMLCSLSELGLTVHDFPYAVADGIFVLQEDCKPGDDLKKAIGLDDTIVEFEITSNRPDCLSVTGLAREAAATFHQPFELHKPVVKGSGGDINDYLSVEVKNSGLCLRYLARIVKNVKIGPSPRWLRERLRASGVRAINNIVDITNYVMLEYGQPLHAFDLRYVKGNKIIVRNAEPGEKVVTLDGIERSLSPEMLVIADEKDPSAVAGVMGGEFSGVNDTTSTIVFESACFLGSSVRLTSKKLGLRTESSSRFEKGLDPATCPIAVNRACELVELLGAGEVVDGVIDVDHSDHTPRVIRLEPEWINRFLGIEVPREEMASILERLSCKVEGDLITVPSFRADLEHKADIAEEIARFYGYDRIPSTGIRGAAQASLTAKQRFESRMVETLRSQGLSEIVTFTFISPKLSDKIRLPKESPLRRYVEITNPLGEDTSVMRTCVFQSMMDILSRNYNNRNESAALFEIGKEFLPGESSAVLPEEIEQVSVGLYGENADFYTLKGVFEALLEAAGITDYDVRAVSDDPTFHPGRCAELLIGGKRAALFGEVHPAVCQNFEIGTRAYIGKIGLLDLLSNANLERSYQPMPRFPASTRDLALTCDDSLPVLSIEKAIRKTIGGLLERVKLFDVYRGAQVGEGKKSVAYSIVMRAPDRTLTDAEVDAAIERTLKELSALGASIRA